MIEVFLIINLQTKQLCAINLETQQTEACYPIGIGKSSSPTPIGEFEVTRLVSQPQYVSCQTGTNHGIGFLGEYAIVTDLDTVLPNCKFAIHGTSKREDLGKEISGGCVRMYNPDIQHLINSFSIQTGRID